MEESMTARSKLSYALKFSHGTSHLPWLMSPPWLYVLCNIILRMKLNRPLYTSKVIRVSPESFWPYSIEVVNPAWRKSDIWPNIPQLFKNQSHFFDLQIANLTVTQIREKLIDLALSIVGSDKKDALTELLTFKGTPNGGIAVTDDLKYTSTLVYIVVDSILPSFATSVDALYLVKFARQNGIHVSPTVLWDGLVVNEISSSWGAQEWSDFLKAKVSV